ncbi:MAG: citrate (Si)-synthase, partial [Acidobacteria bacterium]|nr:citrate (Si)-synthase [Acidobacteriota bacterium]
MEGSLELTDRRTGKRYSLALEDGNVRATDLRQIKLQDGDFGVMSYDPAYLNTASCRSAITYIDGDKGILRYRGYDIEELAENCTFLQVAYLLLYGELPSVAEFRDWQHEITVHTMVHENVKKIMDGFHYDAHPMGMLVSTV